MVRDEDTKILAELRGIRLRLDAIERRIEIRLNTVSGRIDALDRKFSEKLAFQRQRIARLTRDEEP